MIRWLLLCLGGRAARRDCASRHRHHLAAHGDAGCLFAAHPYRAGEYGRCLACADAREGDHAVHGSCFCKLLCAGMIFRMGH